jgi:DNA-binding LacI/PurR family transcriptional regulator
MGVNRVAQLVKQTKTDAWIVFSAPQEILEWFVNRSIPAFALFGRFRQLPIAATGLNKAPAFRAAIRRLAELGHRRIVLLQPKHNRRPSHALLVRESLAEMELQGIKTGPYNLPDWEQSPEGLRERLDALFSLSPPTAIILDRPNELIATLLYLAQRGIFAPRDISLLSDDDPAFEWCEPIPSCIEWKSQPWISRIVRWVNNVANGQEDLRQTFSQARFGEKGTIGPVPTNA